MENKKNINARGLFKHCSTLITIPDISNWISNYNINIISDIDSSSSFSDSLKNIISDKQNTNNENISSKNDNENSNNPKKDFKEFNYFLINKEDESSDYYENFYN